MSKDNDQYINETPELQQVLSGIPDDYATLRMEIVLAFRAFEDRIRKEGE